MRRLSLSAIAAAAALGLSAAPALAKTAPSHVHHPARGAHATARVYLHNAFFVRHGTVDVAHRPIVVSGWLSRYAPRQKVTLIARLGAHTQTLRLKLRPNPGGRTGRFGATISASATGILHLRVVHHSSARLAPFQTGRGVHIISESTSNPLFVALVQQRLLALHLYMPQSGVWDLQTELAIEAYHRLLGGGTSSALDPATLTDLLDGRGAFPVHYPHNGRHAEGDLTLQLVALIDGSKVQDIYPISSGKPSTPTILGNYRVYSRVPGYLPDGMYYSDFFIRGYALHGYDPAPNYPASHGCMRLPISDAISAFNWLALGDWVD
ncbi:MAG: L,D-transpeptidase, partial [Solirubrobacteraceae bacterium]